MTKQAGIVYILIFLLCVTVNSRVTSQSLPDAVPGKFIIKFKDSAKNIYSSKALAAGQVQKTSQSNIKESLAGQELFATYYTFAAHDSSMTIADVYDLFGADNIESVEPDYIVQFFDFPNDSLFAYQWYLHNAGQSYYGIERINGDNNDLLVVKHGTPDQDIRLVNYYTNPPAEHTKVIVGVIDTGIDMVHPDLQDNLWVNPDEIPDNGIDDDHNGFVDDIHGYDISGDVSTLIPVGDNDPTDEHGHGTHIAGIIAASTDNSIGVAGIARNAEILGVKIRPNGTASVAANGIIYAVNNGARVINISWGFPFESGIVKAAIDFANQNGVLVCIAAGNNGDTFRFYPAAYESVLTVAASNSDGYLTYFTSYGGHIDLSAPGEDILSLRAANTDMYADGGEPGVRILDPDSLYYLSDGTSMATPVVVGAAALVWSVRPDLSKERLMQALFDSATDMVDPFNRGDTLVGPDTLGGNGIVNVDAALASVAPAGLAILSPRPMFRYTDDLAVKVLPLGSYNDSWLLEYTVGDTGNWQYLADGLSVPSDSVLYSFTDNTIEGHISIRLTDASSNSQTVQFIYFRDQVTKLDSALSNQTYKYSVPITGSSYGNGYDSVRIDVSLNGFTQRVFASSAEFFDDEMFTWTVSGIDPGDYVVYLEGYYTDTVLVDSVEVTIESAFPAGWPIEIYTRGAFSPVVADLNNDNVNEIIVGTGRGLYVFHPDGTPLDGFPVRPDFDIRMIPAIYDVDKDGIDEIICTDSIGVHVFKYDGSYADGWPVETTTGVTPLGYGYPVPTVAKLGLDQDSAIALINILGDISAYKFNGESYFYSLEGFFSSFYPRINYTGATGQSIMPSISSGDFNQDGIFELYASYSSAVPYSGLGMFDGRSGQPAFEKESALFLQMPYIIGSALADFNNDELLEFAAIGVDSQSNTTFWVVDHDGINLPGWPVEIPEIVISDFIGSYPVIADLNRDMVPEVLFTFMGFDITYLFIFNADGTPYRQLDGAPYGAAYTYNAMFGIPAVGNLRGDEFPEIVLRSGYFFPGTGREQIHMLDYLAEPVEGWPIATPAEPSVVFNTRFAPVIDDIDSDGLVELLIISDKAEMLMYDFTASYNEGENRFRYLGDNLNSNIYRIPQVSTGIDDNDILLPASVLLHQNYPNPFNPTTTIEFDLPSKSSVELDVFNLLGQKVTTLVDENLPAGTHQVLFDAGAYASGMYFYRLSTDEISVTKKMVLVK